MAGAEQDGKGAPREWGPMETLFANYVLSVIGHLPADKEAIAASIAPKLKEALRTDASEWKAIVAESLRLSATIDDAILDLWYTHADLAAAAGKPLEPEAFAGIFVDRYSEEGSKVDVWTGDTLAKARERISTRRGGRTP